MNWETIFAIIAGIIGVIGIVAWASVYTKAGRVWQNLQSLKNEYNLAMSDGLISDSERAKIADLVIKIITDSVDIWQAMNNMVVQILAIVARYRPASKAVLKKIKR